MRLPNHVAFIVDGNRRWAKKRGLPALSGHRKAAEETIKNLVYHAKRLGIKYLTFWLFSTENWKRGQRFYNPLFALIKEKVIRESLKKYLQDGIRLNLIGDLSKLPKDLVGKLTELEEKSKKNKEIVVTFALNYGGREEIVRAVRRLSSKLKTQMSKVTEEEFSKYLDTAGMPDPDLIIRTGGEKRLSGFLPWQSEYTELYFTNQLFPDFSPQEFDKALKDFSLRERRYGK